MKRVILAAAVAVLSFVGFGGTLRQSVITVSGYAGSETLTDFPVLVRLSPTTVSGFSYADCAADGRDIRFATTDGTPLPFEIDMWNPGGESCFWVKLPALEKDTVFVLSYGVTTAPKAPAENIWAASGYEGVWHLGEPRYWAYNASTNDWFTGLPAGDGATLMVGQPGLIGTGRCLGTSNGAKSYLNFADYKANGLNLGSTFTFSGWYHVTAQRGSSTWTRLAARSNNQNSSGTADGWGVQLNQSTTSLTVYSGNGNQVVANFDDIKNRWACFSFVFAETKATVYVDGESKATGAISGVKQTQAARPLCVCNSDGGQDAWLAGTLDEVRLSSVARSADWTKAEYDTVMTADFLSCGAVTPVAPSALAMNQTLYLTSSAFGSSEVSALVTGVGAEPATLTFEYGPSSDALDHSSAQTVTAAGEYGAMVPCLVSGQAYCVKATLSAGGTVIESDVFEFIQPEVAEEGVNPRLRADLPTGYVQMEKLVSTGKQRILTKIVPTPTTSVEFEFGECQSAAVASSIFGQGWGDNYYMLDTQSGKNNFFFHGTGTTDLQMPINPAHDYRVTVEPNLLKAKYAELVIADMTAPAATTTQVSIAVQANKAWNFFGAQDKTDKFSTCSFYSFKSWDNGTLTGDFVPVWSEEKQMAGLYDFVTQEFYGNQETGTTFARQPRARDVALRSAGGQLVVTVVASDENQTVSVCSDEAYRGTDGWTTTSEPIVIPAGETTASVDLPTGWGTTVFFARARLGSGADAIWSKTVIAPQTTETLAIGAKLERESSTLDSSDISAFVSGLGSGASEATLVFKYGTAQDALDREVVVTGITTPGDWCGTLEHLQLGATYFVQATLTNDVGGSVSSDVFSFVQPTPEGTSELRTIPGGYEPVSSVCLNGATYLTTEIYPSRSTRAVVSYMSRDSSHDKMIFGERNGNYPFLLWCGNTSGLLLSPICGSSNASALPYGVSGNTTIKYGDVVTVDFGFGGVYYSVNGGEKVVVDSAETVAAQAVDKTASYPLVLFGMYQNGSIEGRKFYGNCYWFKLYEGDELVHDYVPMRETTGEKRVVLWDYAKNESVLPTAGAYSVGEGTCPPVVRIGHEPVSEVGGVSPATGAYLGEAGRTYLFSAPTEVMMGSAVCTLTGYSVYEAGDSGETCVKEGTGTMFDYTFGSNAVRVVWHWSLSGPPAFSTDPVAVSHAFGSAVVSIEVAGLGSASEATLTFAYGTTPAADDCTVSVTVTEPGAYNVTLPHLTGGQTYYVKATLDNHDAESVTSAANSFDQPEVEEPGGASRYRADLPAGYRQMEKLVSTGNQRIATKIVPTATTTVEFEFGECLSKGTMSLIFGQEWGNPRYMLDTQSGFADFCYHGAGNSLTTGDLDLGVPIVAADDYRVTMALRPGDPGYADLTLKDVTAGNEVTTRVDLGLASGKVWHFFGAPNNGSVYSKYSFYLFKSSDNGVLTGDFVPVLRASDSKAGLYDFVSKEFYTTDVGTAFVQQDFEQPPLALLLQNGRLSIALPPSEGPRTVRLHAGETYGGVDDWGDAVAVSNVAAGVTAVGFDKPAGWGTDVFFVRVQVDDGSDALWSNTLIWQPAAPLGVEKPTYVSSEFGSAVVAAQVTGIGKTAASATLAFAYGTTPDCADGTVQVPITDAGSWSGTLPHLIAGQTYYVKATLTNTAGDTPVTSAVFEFVQPESAEPGVPLGDRWLPAGYVQMKKLTATGKEYVLIDYWKPDNKTSAEVELGEFTSIGESSVFGQAYNSNMYLMTIQQNVFKWYGGGSQVSPDNPIPMDGTKYQIKIDALGTGNGDVTVSNLTTGVAAKLSNTSLAANGSSFAVFSDTEKKHLASYSLYSFQAWKNDQISIDLVPAYKTATGEAGLVDLVTGEFRASATTTAFAQQDFVEFAPLELKDDKLVLTVPASESERLAYLCSGETYGGTNGWTTTSESVTIPAGETTVEFALPEGWGETAFFARARIGEGDAALWSKTCIWQDPTIPAVVLGELDGLGGDTLIVKGKIDSLGGASCTLKVMTGTSEDAITEEWTGLEGMTVTETGDFEFSLFENDTSASRYLTPGETYFVRVVATGASGKVAWSSVKSVTMANAAVFKSTSVTYAKRVMTVTAQMAEIGICGTVDVELWVGADAGSLAKVAGPVTVTKPNENFTLSYELPLYETPYVWQLKAINVTAGETVQPVTPTETKDALAPDSTTYTWTGAGADNSWTNSANWSDNKDGDSLGYPQTKNSTATFAMSADVEIDLPRSGTTINSGTLNLGAKNIDVRFHSADTNSFGLVLNGLTMPGQGSRWTIDHAYVYRNANGTISQDSTIVVTNRADLYLSNVYFSNLSSQLEIRDESKMSVNDFYGGKDGSVVIADSTFEVRAWTYAGNYDGSLTVRFEGTHPRWSHLNVNSPFRSTNAKSPVTLDFLIPEGGYEFVPLHGVLGKAMNNAFGGNASETTYPITVNVLDESPAAFVRGEATYDLISWSKGINTAKVVTNNVPHEVPGSEFVWSDETTSPTGLAVKIVGYVASNFILVKSNDGEFNPEGFNADSGYGKHSLADGAQVTLAAPTSYYDLSDDERVYIVGWELWSKLDDDSNEMSLVKSSANPGDGEDTHTCKYTHEHYSEFVWLWRHQKRVKVTVVGGEHGSVSSTEQWIDAGATSSVTATPEEGYAVAWTAGIANERMFENPLVIDETVDPYDLTAEFFQPSANEGEKAGLFASYKYSMPITFAGYDGTTTLTNFPALIRLGEGTGSFTYADCASDGRDVRFCDAAGNELDSEIVKFDSNGTSEFWVKVPVLSPRNTRIFVVWGNGNPAPRNVSARVWDGEFRGVWGLGRGRNLALDSTGNDQHGVCVEENGISSVPGIVGDARRFAGLGAGNRFDLGCGSEVNLEPSQFTIECWFRVDAFPSDYSYFITSQSIGDYQGGRCYTFGIDNTGTVFARPNGYYDTRANYRASSAAPVAAGGWHHAAFVYSGTVATVFVDGVKGTSYTANPFDGWGRPTARPRVAELSGDNSYKQHWRYYAGDLDEMRFSSVMRSADYLRATYLTVASNETFAVFGTEAHPSLMVDGVVQPLAPAIEVSAPEGEQGGVRRTCMGYAVVADGKLVESGEGASVSRTWPSNATDVAVAWNWKTEYEVSVNGATQWCEAGTLLPVTAGEAPEGKAFHSWDGDCPKLETFSDSFDLPVDRPRTIAASFAPVTDIVAGEDAAANGTALNAAVAAAVATGARAVVRLGAGEYENAVAMALSGPVVVCGAGDGPARVHSQVTAFNLSNDDAAIVGLEVYYHGTKNNLIRMTHGAALDCVFDGLKTRCDYSGVYLASMSGGWVRRTVFRNSSLHSGGCANFGRMLVDSCIFTNNTSSGSSGCVNLGTLDWAGATRIQNSIIANNGPYMTENINGGGLSVRYNGCIIENCTIADNWNCGNTATGNKGGGLYVDASYPCVVVNTIFSGNKTNAAKEDGDDFYGPIAFVNSLSKEMTGTEYGSSVAQAAFVEDDDGTYHPRATSPSVDAGYPTAWSRSLGAWDFGGTNRVEGVAVDIGAREFHLTGDEALDVNVAADKVSGLDTLTVSFTSTVIGAKGEVTFAWDFGDGTVATNTTGAVSHTYTHAGYYTVVLEVSDGTSKATFTGTDLISVLPSTCYVNGNGSHTAPYDTREKGAEKISDVFGFAPSKIVLCDGTTSSQDGGGTPTVNFKTIIEGESVTNTFIHHRLKLAVAGSVIRNTTYDFRCDGYNDSRMLTLNEGVVASNLVICGLYPGSGSVGAVSLQKNSKLVDCLVYNNNQSARVWDKGAILQSGSGAAAIGIEGAGALVDHCVITNNAGGTANGVYAAGIRVFGDYSPAPVIRNSLIGYNFCVTKGGVDSIGGAGIYANGSVVVENCTIVSNRTDGAGAGVYVKAGTAEIVNTIIASNVGGLANAAEICSNEVFVAEGASATWQKCRVPAEAGIDDAGVTTVDPMFNFGARSSIPYWGILGDSPLKNKGVKRDWMTPEAKDLNGQKRVFNAKPDLGCYESQVGGTVIIVR